MMARWFQESRPFSLRTVALLLFCAAGLFGITALPYLGAYANAPEGRMFGGVLNWAPDQDCYFSFIRQSADGHWIFLNRLTSLPHERAYFNLEWLLVGRVMALFDGSTVWAYQIWRAAGAISVVFGFYALVRVAIRDPRIRWIALFLGFLGGSFLWLFSALDALSRGAEALFGWHLGQVSTEFGYFATHPIAQILANPHFACPLGVFMAAIAAFLQGESSGRSRWYVLSGVLAAIEATMRPYEMIVLYTAVPLFAGVEIALSRKLDRQKLRQRLTPLLIVAPVFAYTIYIFEIHPIFKYWSSQGVDAPIPIAETLSHLGMAGVLLAVRACFLKRFPLNSPAERMLLAWFACVFFFIHANTIPFLRFMPYTPQLMTSLMPSIILLGVPVLDPSCWKWSRARPRLWVALVIGILSVEAIDTFQLLEGNTPTGGPADAPLYIRKSERKAFEWLAHNASEDDVVISTGANGHRLTKYASVCVVSGHWSVTPMADRMEVEVERFYRGKMSPAVAADFLDRHRVKWVYCGPTEGPLVRTLMESIPGYAPHVVDRDVTIYGPRS
jgi:hypothetical protein